MSRATAFTSSVVKTLTACIILLLTACSGGSSHDQPAANSNSTADLQDSIEKPIGRPNNPDCLAPDNAAEVAAMLSQTGCYTNTATRTVAPGVIFYTVNNLLWTDGEKKGRYFAIPDNTTLSFNTEGGMLFPIGSVVIKEFFRAGKIVETRLLMRHANDGWRGYSYQWENEDDAILLTSSSELHDHYYPNEDECFACHTSQVDITIGNEALQQNYFVNYTNGERENFLDMLSRLNLLSAPLDEQLKTQRLYAIDDSSATLEQRARSYLHSNCMGCHRPGAPGGGVTLLYTASLLQMGCNVDANDDPIGISNPKIIEPGNSRRSALYRRLLATSGFQMPPIGRETVDREAVGVIAQWIDSLSDCNDD
jgi:mono/diheme cytochrome c family protein